MRADPPIQLNLFPVPTRSSSKPTEQQEVDLATYDHVIVAFSGGKDSWASFLHLIDRGAKNIELWHHCVDGEGPTLFDWPCTRAYVAAAAAAFGVSIYFSHKVGGFEREMLRSEEPTAPIRFETPTGPQEIGGTSRKIGTRRRFPQLSSDLSVRWCSAYLKIDVAAAALRNQDRFLGKRTLFVTGERAAESPARAQYPTFTPHRTDTRHGVRRARHVDHWRPVHAWSAEAVWAILERYSVQYHPAYALGFGRLSCAACIFGSVNQWATVNLLDPLRVRRLIAHEQDFGITLRRGTTIDEMVRRGRAYEMAPADIERAMSGTFSAPIILPAGAWSLPPGAFGEAHGPS